jgi:hypothetical protein
MDQTWTDFRNDLQAVVREQSKAFDWKTQQAHAKGVSYEP